MDRGGARRPSFAGSACITSPSLASESVLLPAPQLFPVPFFFSSSRGPSARTTSAHVQPALRGGQKSQAGQKVGDLFCAPHAPDQIISPISLPYRCSTCTILVLYVVLYSYAYCRVTVLPPAWERRSIQDAANHVFSPTPPRMRRTGPFGWGVRMA